MDNRDVYQERWCAEEYDTDRFGGRFGRYLHDWEVDLYVSLIGDRGGRVLDAGAGTGKLSLSLARRVRRVVSVDSSAEMLTIAKRKAQRDALPLNAIVCDLHHLCFRDQAFDTVTCSRVLMHLGDWERAVAELCRVSGDVVVLDFPPLLSFAGLEGPIKRLIKRLASRARGYKVFRVGHVIEELRRNGFEAVTVRREFVLPVALHRLLNRPAMSLAIERLLAGVGLRALLGAPVVLKAVRNDRGVVRSRTHDKTRLAQRALDPA